MAAVPLHNPRAPGPTLGVTAYGRPALTALREAITTAKGADPLAPVTVVVPDNFVGVAARRGLARGHHGTVVPGRIGLAGANFVTIDRLAQLLAAPAMARDGRRPVNKPIIAAAVRRVLAKRSGVFAAVAQHPTTELRLVEAHRELSSLGPAELNALAATSARSRDVVRVHREVSTILSHGWYGEHDLLLAASRAVSANSAGLSTLGPVIVYLPQDVSPAGAELLQALGSRVPCTILAGLTGVDAADATVLASLGRLGIAPPPAPAPAHTNIEVVSVSDADDEVRHVVRAIVDAARAGTPFDRMAVVYPKQRPYARLLHDHLEGAGIVHNGVTLTTLAQSAAGRMLRRLLTLRARDFRREDVTALLSGSPMQWEGRAIPSRAWDQISRDAGVTRGEQDWEDKLQAFIADCSTELEQSTSTPMEPWHQRKLAERVHLARSLQAFMVTLAGRLEQAHTLTSWSARAEWSQELLHSYVGHQRSWPEPQRRATERIRAILAGLVGLDAIEPNPSSSVFARTLDLQLEEGWQRVGSFGGGILVGNTRVCMGLDLDHVWVLGMVEGSFPSRPRDNSLLPDHEHRAGGGVPLRSNSVGDEHRHLLTALAAAGSTGMAHLMWPRGDLRQANEHTPSRWLLDIAGQRAGQRLTGKDLERLDRPWIRHVPSFASGILAAEFPATGQEFDLRSLVEEMEANGTANGHRLLGEGSPLARGAALQAGRAGRAFTRFDGNLGGLRSSDHARATRATSATALETYARCPHQYLMRYVLGVHPLETPEYRLRVDPMTRGNIIHRVLERFVNGRGEHLPDAQSPAWSQPDRHRLHGLAAEEFQAAETRGLTGEALFWRRDQVLLLRDLDAFFDADGERRALGRLRPVATELAFGVGDVPAVQIDLPNGAKVALRGSIDLVDEDPDGNLVVTDYKTGRRIRLRDGDPHNSGTRLQLVLYAAAAQAVLHRPDVQVTSMYWHISARANYQPVGYTLSPEISASALAAVATIVDGIDHGVFPQHPEESTRTQWVSCHYCDPDGLGTSDARRRMIRKADQRELAEYLRLAEPRLAPQPAPSAKMDAHK